MGGHEYYRGEGGTIIKLDLPLPEVMAEKVTKGYLRRVNEDGSPYVEMPADVGGPPQPAMQRPAQSASKAEWVGYAVRVHGLAPDDAEAMTKQDLIDKYGRDPAPTPDDGQQQDDPSEPIPDDEGQGGDAT